MATAAQIAANKRNARRSTGPKTEAGKARARMNARKHGRRAKIEAPVLPQEDPAELEARIRRWVEDLRPGDDVERALAERAAKTSFELDRLERCEIAQLTVRVRKAQAQVQGDDETADQVCDLGGKLLYLASITTTAGTRFLASSKPPWQDDPEAFLRGLEGSAEGCRWLRDRWAELGRLLRREGRWTLVDLYRSIRLQGQHPVGALDDPDLNLQFLAWGVLEPTGATDAWKRCREMAPQHGNGLDGCREWREIADRPASREEALAVINGVIDGRIARLEERIALYEEVGDEEAAERADAASFDPGPEAEALRRRRSILTRELRQLIELILKMQAASRRASREGDREGEAPAERGADSEVGIPAGGRKTFTAEGTEGTEERGSAVMTDNDRAGRERTETKPARRAGSRAPLILPGSLEMIVEGGLADEVRALARGMSGGRPDVPLSVTRGPNGETNEPNSRKTENLWRKEDTPCNSGPSGGDRSQSSDRGGAT